MTGICGMAAISVVRVPFTFRAALRDRHSYMAHASLHVTVLLLLLRLAGLKNRVYRDEAGSVWARYVPQSNPSRMAWPEPRVLFTVSYETGCAVKERLHLDVRSPTFTWSW